MIAVMPEGTDLSFDIALLGAQIILEHRIAIYGNTLNQLKFRVNGLFSPSFMESQVDAELRMLALTVGGAAGYRDTFRNQTYQPGEELSIDHRLSRDVGSDVTNEAWPFFEGRATISLPFNDWVVFNSVNRLRHEERPTASFDWRLGVVHDQQYFASENMLLLKNRDLGGIGPMVQILRFERAETPLTQFNFGAVFTSRVGLRRHNDLFFIQVLFNTGWPGTDATQTYGLHLLTVPMMITVAYRVVLPVWRPD